MGWREDPDWERWRGQEVRGGERIHTGRGGEDRGPEVERGSRLGEVEKAGGRSWREEEMVTESFTEHLNGAAKYPFFILH